jgi:hypothetical protein
MLPTCRYVEKDGSMQCIETAGCDQLQAVDGTLATVEGLRQLKLVFDGLSLDGEHPY